MHIESRIYLVNLLGSTEEMAKFWYFRILAANVITCLTVYAYSVVLTDVEPRFLIQALAYSLDVMYVLF